MLQNKQKFVISWWLIKDFEVEDSQLVTRTEAYDFDSFSRAHLGSETGDIFSSARGATWYSVFPENLDGVKPQREHDLLDAHPQLNTISAASGKGILLTAKW